MNYHEKKIYQKICLKKISLKVGIDLYGSVKIQTFTSELENCGKCLQFTESIFYDSYFLFLVSIYHNRFGFFV